MIYESQAIIKACELGRTAFHMGIINPEDDDEYNRLFKDNMDTMLCIYILNAWIVSWSLEYRGYKNTFLK